MMIRCTLERKGGTVVDIDDDTYHFKPQINSKGAHVAEVTNPKHIGRFLGITEAYEVSELPPPPLVDLEAPVSRPPTITSAVPGPAGLTFDDKNYGVIAGDAREQKGPDMLHKKAENAPEPESKGFTLTMLKNMVKEDLIDEFGRGTEANLKIDRRRSKATIVQLISKKLGLI